MLGTAGENPRRKASSGSWAQDKCESERGKNRERGEQKEALNGGGKKVGSTRRGWIVTRYQLRGAENWASGDTGKSAMGGGITSGNRLETPIHEGGRGWFLATRQEGKKTAVKVSARPG